MDKYLIIRGVLMRKICRIMGSICLGVAALIAVIGPASVGGVAVEEMPKSIKSKR